MSNTASFPVPNERSNRFRFIRVECLGLKQGELAAKLGLTQMYVSNLETGRRNATPSSIAHYSELLGIDADCFYPERTSEEQVLASVGKSDTEYLEHKRLEAFENFKRAYGLNDTDSEFIEWLSLLPKNDRSAFYRAVRSIREL